MIDDANVLLHNKKYDEAIELFQKYLIENGDNNVVHAKLASAYCGLNDYESAAKHATWSIANGPGNGEAHYLYGAVLGGLYDVQGALRETDVALNLTPMHPHALWNKALYSLQLGDYDNGFHYYQYGVLSGGRPLRNLYPKGSSKEWRGKKIHVYCEQGHGDVFMFARYLRILKLRYQPEQIILEVYKDLIPIFYNHKYADIVYARPENFYMPYPDVDFSLSLMDIAILCRTEDPLDARLESRPYNIQPWPQDVSISPELLEPVAPYIDELNPGKKMKVGICWQGSTGHANDANRSSTFEDFVQPFLEVDNVQFFALQYGEEVSGKNLHNLGNELANWAITGAYLTQMDLLISVDTAIAHLAGVLGTPTWIICPFANEWRWGYHPTEQGWNCDWYGSSTRIFRQTVRKDWTSIIPQVVNELKKLASWHKTTPTGQQPQKSLNS